MNQDNPSFRTEAEERRAAEYVTMRDELVRTKAGFEYLVSCLPEDCTAGFVTKARRIIQEGPRPSALESFHKGLTVVFLGDDSADACENFLQETKAAFVHVCPETKTHTAVKTMEFWDDAVVIEIPAETLLHLYNLQTEIELLKGTNYELSFDAIVEAAGSLKACFDRALEAIKFKPILSKNRKSEFK